MKTILGLDLGTNSIGWALIAKSENEKDGKILGIGSRIIPMSQDILGDFSKGNSISQTAERTGYRGVRRLRERHLLRRERLHRVLNVLGFLPNHYANLIDFEKRLGQFKAETEPKLAYQEIGNEEKQKNKYDFIFKESFKEMLNDFREHQPKLLENDRKIPYDWTIYFLRKKALTQKIEKEELAWILLNFNQKRGYYQLRGEEEEENPNKLVEFYSLKVIDVQADEPQKGKEDIWYSLVLESGLVYRRSSKTPLFDWKDKVKDFIITTDLNDDGTIKIDKDGKEKRHFRAPSEDDWTLIKKKTETEIDSSGKTVGTFIYDTLLQNPKQKINGKLVRTIERKFYKDELKQILQKQQEFHSELQSEDLFNNSIRELYKYNEAHQFLLSKRDFVHLFLDDIIFYQRPLKSQKASISNCSFEYKKYNVNGEEKTIYLKSIPKSHPLYQEFRLWQWIYNLRIYKKDDDYDVTNDFLKNNEDYEDLFEYLNNRKEVDQKALLKHFKLKDKTHRWNFVEDKKYPCNETRTLIKTRLEKVENLPDNFLTEETEKQLWHIIYSVTDKIEYEKALKTFAKKHRLEANSFVENFKKFPPFKSEFGSYSAKALKKLLPLMRIGKYWNDIEVTTEVKDRVNSILERLQAINFNEKEIENVADDDVQKQVLKSFLKQKDFTKGLQLYQASYLVYGRHSEAAIAGKWYSVSDLEEYLKEFKQHSLRNPIVEQIITETLRVVKDIWQQYGKGDKDFFEEIHIELGREMKNTAEDRKKITNQVIENENTNLRIKALLLELKNDSSIENIRPYSPIQQEILKIFEDGILSSDIEIPDDIVKISKTAQPSSSELQRYKLWLEQKYRSPYTGQMIPLNKLFTADYEIEHIIPQSRYFDDSFNNKVICEAAANKLKDNQTGLEFIKNHHREIVQTGLGKSVKIFEVKDFEDFVKSHYAKNRSKRNKLLMEDIPEKMIERQINDTRYISKFISAVLSNIVRSDHNDDGINSKNIIPGNGKITNILKQDWGLNDVWNDLILPRFKRMNRLTNSTAFTLYNERYQKHQPTVPLELSKNFQKKRIDHRHHALDALVIACATRDHVNLLNNKYAKSDERFDLNRKLRKFEKVSYIHPKIGKRVEKEIPKDFLKPWANFTVDAKKILETIVVSFKQNLRVINKTTNKYESYKDENGNLRIGKDGKPVKDVISQISGDRWAIRKPMHKETVSGKIVLNRITVPNGKILTATRKSVDTSFNLKTIESITDTGIQKILKNYLSSKENNPELAFSAEGLEDMNKNIEKYNNGKPHQPIYKARLFELGSKFQLGQTGNKKAKYVEAAKGTNLFFAIYQDEDGKRSFETIPLNIVIERQKQGLHSIPEINEKGDKLLFHLSPNDLVYVPSEEDIENPISIDFSNLSTEQLKRVYKFTDGSGTTMNFIPANIASLLFDLSKKEQEKIGVNLLIQNELGVGSPQSKNQNSLEGIQIKSVCWKLKVDRLGNINSVIGK
ncbi:MAG: type II CRISPR RNA-guided endonuclease Cas9 [Ignavibacteriales bacterium CG_4_9_14_3_um_filter_34_10]|nr:MAG: type II CRISPR RNA-guided endonuclease Cas9 [Ignavibacteriales bacterium CG_4_9_14_3_um_filter_34_10]